MLFLLYNFKNKLKIKQERKKEKKLDLLVCCVQRRQILIININFFVLPNYNSGIKAKTRLISRNYLEEINYGRED